MQGWNAHPGWAQGKPTKAGKTADPEAREGKVPPFCCCCLMLSHCGNENPEKFKKRERQRHHRSLSSGETKNIYFLYKKKSHESFFKKKILFIYVRGREHEREGNINVWLPLTRPQLATKPTTQACALTGNHPATH